MRVAIAGYGKEGEANYRYWKAQGDEVVIYDDKETSDTPLPEGAEAVCKPGATSSITGVDLIIRTAGLSPFKLPAGIKTWSGTREFFAQCPATIIGVTGTKGKGTTCSMITEILRASGKTVHLIGNIGVPAIEELAKVHAEDIVVFELSSFQLWDLGQSPHIAVVLGIEPDHLNVHASYEDYIAAKANIAIHQKKDDILIFKSTNEVSRGVAGKSPGTQVSYGVNAVATIRDGFFYYGDQKLFPTSVMQVPGDHNKENACAAVAAVWQYVQDATIIENGLRNFKGLPHRIEKVRELNGITFYDDSFSSAAAATVVAVQSFSSPTILILGGFDRGIDLMPLAETLSKSSNIKKVVCIGATRVRLAQAFDAVHETRYEVMDTTDFPAIVKHAHELANSGDVVLLSPGAASFDMFKNFTERGDMFKKIVFTLQNPPSPLNRGAQPAPFTFVDYSFDASSRTATFTYASGDCRFTERITFSDLATDYNAEALDRALFLAYVIAGASYYKAFPSHDVVFEHGTLDAWQAQFFNSVFQDGLSQFAFENKLTRDNLAHFVASTEAGQTAIPYAGKGVIALQSGGKDSLLTASFLQEKNIPFTPWYISNNPSHPEVLDDLGFPLRTTNRAVDVPAIKQAIAEGGLNGHVPVTYMVLSLALIDAILTNKNTVLVSIGHEGDEPHEFVGDMPVNHQWSKTWEAEVAFAEYVRRYISPDIQVGSPLRSFSELRVAELFAVHAWPKFGHRFSSCNVANYKQGNDNTTLAWCGDCPKCANSFLLFAPFVEPKELASIFGGENLLTKPSLIETFKGILGIEGTMKPFECIGETTELQLAYAMAREKWPDAGYTLSFDVPSSNFDYMKEYESQEWAKNMLFSDVQ
jgi:UDP-N-acetylmuramoylalanine--D-glutamate ligase